MSPLLHASLAQTHIELQAGPEGLRGQNWAPFEAQGTSPAGNAPDRGSQQHAGTRRWCVRMASDGHIAAAVQARLCLPWAGSLSLMAIMMPIDACASLNSSAEQQWASQSFPPFCALHRVETAAQPEVAGAASKLDLAVEGDYRDHI